MILCIHNSNAYIQHFRQNSFSYLKIPLDCFSTVYLNISCNRNWLQVNQLSDYIVVNIKLFWLCEHSETPILTRVDAIT